MNGRLPIAKAVNYIMQVLSAVERAHVQGVIHRNINPTNMIVAPVPADCLPHLSPLGWEHINLTGDYLWDLRQTTTLQRLRTLRRGTLSVQNGPESKAG